MEPLQIFISYSRHDKKTMRHLRSDLQSTGFRVWTDEAIIPGSPSWKVDVNHAILSSQCLLVVLSPEARNSQWVLEEIDFAKIHDKPIFSVLIRGDEKAAVPFGLAGSQWIDLRKQENYIPGMIRLIEAIHLRLGSLTVPNLGFAEPSNTKHRLIHGLLFRIVVSILLMLMAIGTITFWWFANQGNGSIEIVSERTIPNDWIKRHIEDMTISIPSSWNHDIDPEFGIELLERVAGDPEKAAAFQAALPLNISMMVGDLNGFVGIAIIKQPVPLSLPLNIVRERSIRLFESVNLQVIDDSTLLISDKEMLRIVVLSKNPDVSGGIITYYLSANNQIYYICFLVGASNEVDTLLRNVLNQSETIMQTFQVNVQT